MKTKSIIVTLIFMLCLNNSFSQVKIEAQLGGSGLIGVSLNTLVDIKLSQNGYHLLTPSLGLGMFIPIYNEYICSINLGLNYNYLKYGFGVYLIGNTPMPFFGKGGDEDLVIAYPNVNYTAINKRKWYFKISAGAYLPFSRINKSNGNIGLSLNNYFFPGIGLILGYKSCN